MMIFLEPPPRPLRSRRILAALALATTMVGLSADACIIADPPTDLPQLPLFRPVIVRDSVVPTASAVLGTWPAGDRFIVPVELVDPRVTFQYSTFVDFNPITGDGLDTRPTLVPPIPSQASDRIRVIEVPITKPSLDECHVVEVIVALQFASNPNQISDGRGAHTPSSPGGDSVMWFFSPGGDLAGCPVVDAGIVGDSGPGAPSQ